MAVLRGFIPERIAHWHNIELPDVSVQFADLLAESESGRLWHIELQSSNDPGMPVRMLDYAVRVLRKFGRLPSQAVLYVGREPVRMRGELIAEGLAFQYRVVDIRSLDADALLESPAMGDGSADCAGDRGIGDGGSRSGVRGAILVSEFERIGRDGEGGG